MNLIKHVLQTQLDEADDQYLDPKISLGFMAAQKLQNVVLK